MNNNTQRIEWLDSLRVLAIIGVIVIHTSTPVVKMSYGWNMVYWWIGNIVNSTVRFAVPVFLMLSGATMIERKYKLRDFYKKRVMRVLVPLLFWMIVYWIFRWYSLPAAQKPYGFFPVLEWAGNLFLNEGISKHLWYIYMILFIYIFVPLLAYMIRNMSRAMLLFLLGTWMLLCSVSMGFSLNMYNWSGDYLSKFYGYFLYSGYLILGFFIYKHVDTSRNIRLIAAIVFLFTIFLSAFIVYYASQDGGKLNLTVYSYLNLNTIVQSSAVFLMLKDVRIKTKILLKFQQLISDYSFGIYLVHILIIGIFFQNRLFWTIAHPIISLPILTLATLVTSFIVIWILRKIPFGKYISG